jgi:hypothetical protein
LFPGSGPAAIEHGFPGQVENRIHPFQDAPVQKSSAIPLAGNNLARKLLDFVDTPARDHRPLKPADKMPADKAGPAGY